MLNIRTHYTFVVIQPVFVIPKNDMNMIKGKSLSHPEEYDPHEMLFATIVKLAIRDIAKNSQYASDARDFLYCDWMKQACSIYGIDHSYLIVSIRTTGKNRKQ